MIIYAMNERQDSGDPDFPQISIISSFKPCFLFISTDPNSSSI